MPKIVDFALPPGGTIVDVAPSNATALDIESAGADYITVDTTGSGSVIIGKLLTLEAGMTFSGATTFTIPDNTENAFLVEDSTGADYLQCDTRNGAEILRLSSVGVAGVEIHVASGDAEVRLADEVGFISDPDLMLRRKTNNSLEFRVAGTDIFGIDGSGAYLENGNLGVGTLSPAHKAHVQDGDIGIVKNSADAVGSKLIFEKSRNNTDGDHTKVNDNDVLGTVEFRGSDTNTFEAGASIIARVQGTPADGSMPAELAFAVTPSGSTTPVEALNIRSNGHVGIGDVFPNYRLHVAQNGSTSASVFYNTSTTGAGAGTAGSMSAYFENKVGPTIKLNNAQHEDSDGGRETGIAFAGEKANAGEQHTLAQIMVSHDGTGDDQKGKFTISVNDGDDDHAPSLTPFTVYSNGYVGVGNNAPDNAVFNVRQSVATNPVCQIENTGVGTALRIQSGTDSSSHDIFRVFNGAGVQKFGCRADGPVFVGATSMNNKEFEVNNGTNSIYFDIDTNDNFMVSNKPLSIYGGGATVNAMQAAKYGVQKFRFAMAQSDGTRTSDTNTDQPAYLADSGATIICDLKFGCVGAFTLTADVTHVKFWNVPDLGTAQTITVKIKQHASSAKTISYSTVNIYSDAGSTTKNGSLLWSGGAGHVMSAGVDDIDIVQFTVIPTSTSDRDVYGAVIGQNFS